MLVPLKGATEVVLVVIEFVALGMVVVLSGKVGPAEIIETLACDTNMLSLNSFLNRKGYLLNSSIPEVDVADAPPFCAALKFEIIGVIPSPVPTFDASKHSSLKEAARDLFEPGDVTYDSYAASHASQLFF